MSSERVTATTQEHGEIVAGGDKASQRHYYHTCQDASQPGRMSVCGFMKGTPPSLDPSRERCPECVEISSSPQGVTCPACYGPINV